MATKSAAAINFHNTSIPATWNWTIDSQPERHANAEEYKRLARELTLPSLAFAASTLTSARYIKPEQEDETVERLKNLKPKEPLILNGVAVLWRIKSKNAIKAKILKDGKNPDDIGDYFGIKFVGETVGDIQRLRNAVLSASNISSRKCEFTYPSERGYRSHKSHHQIRHEGHSLSIEAMITHADFEKSERLTHLLMETERRILDRQATEKDTKLSRKFASCATGLKSQRTLINHETAADAGLNILCAPDAVISCADKPTIDNWARKICNSLTTAVSVVNFSNDSSLPTRKIG